MNNFNLENGDVIAQYNHMMNESLINQHGLSYFLKNVLKLQFQVSEADEDTEKDLKKLDKPATFIKNAILLSGLSLSQHFEGVLGRIAADIIGSKIAKKEAPVDAPEPDDITKEELFTRLFGEFSKLSPANFKKSYRLIERINNSTFKHTFTKKEFDVLVKMYVILLALELLSKDKKTVPADRKSRAERIYRTLGTVAKRDIADLTA